MWTLLAEQEGHQVVKENLEVIKVNPEECTQTVQLAESVGEAPPPEIAQHSATTESELAMPPGEDGPLWFRTIDTTSADVTTVAKLVGEARPLGIVKHSALTESWFAKSSRIKADGTNSAAATAVVKSVDEARPPGFPKYHVTCETESEPAESSSMRIVQKITMCVKVGEEANPDGEQLILRLCEVGLELSKWFDQAEQEEATQRCLDVFSNVLAFEQELDQGSFSDIWKRLEHEIFVLTALVQEQLVLLCTQAPFQNSTPLVRRQVRLSAPHARFCQELLMCHMSGSGEVGTSPLSIDIVI